MKKIVSIVILVYLFVSLISCGNDIADTINCENCGGENEITAKYCNSCGKSIFKENENTDSNKVAIPDIVNIEYTDAKNVLSSMGFIPQVEYENSDTVSEGCVIRCTPQVGALAEKGSKVICYVSKGSSYTISKDSYANWTYITYGIEDEWEFYSPYINDGVLYIECFNVVFGTAMEWRDRYNEGSAAGTASINDTFDKVVPVRVEYEKRKTEANEPQSFTIIVPLSELNVSKPTNMYFRVGITANDQDTNLVFNFSMTW